MVESHSSNFRVSTTNILAVRIFRKFTVHSATLSHSVRKHTFILKSVLKGKKVPFSPLNTFFLLSRHIFVKNRQQCQLQNCNESLTEWHCLISKLCSQKQETEHFVPLVNATKERDCVNLHDIWLSHIMRKPAYAICANNKTADQPAHMHSAVFVVRCLDSIIPLLAIAEISRP